MKKKLTLTLLALICALFCAFGLAACDNKECIGIVASSESSTEKTGNVDLGKYVFGDDDKINTDLAKVKFYKHFDDGSDVEVAVTELNVKRTCSINGQTVDENSKFYCSDGNSVGYFYEYSLTGKTNTVQVSFEVEPAKRDDFSITLSKTQWKQGEKSATVTIKNFDGTVMQKNRIGTNMKKDDTDCTNISLFAMRKETYDGISAENKKKYEIFTTNEDDENSPNLGYNKYFGKALMDYTEDNDYYEDLPPHEYVLIACVGYTNNYKDIVCTAEFTVTE